MVNGRTVINTKHGNSKEFKVKVRLHQGSVLSPILFMVAMGTLTSEAR